MTDDANAPDEHDGGDGEADDGRDGERLPPDASNGDHAGEGSDERPSSVDEAAAASEFGFDVVRPVDDEEAEAVDAPLSDLVERTRRAEDRTEEDDPMDAFEAVEVDDVEVAALWEQLEADRAEETVEEPRSDAGRDVQTIGKRDYCMRCQYFSAPPEVRCTHERGEILELVDTDRFTVADCPILAGEEELENLRR